MKKDKKEEKRSKKTKQMKKEKKKGKKLRMKKKLNFAASLPQNSIFFIKKRNSKI